MVPRSMYSGIISDDLQEHDDRGPEHRRNRPVDPLVDDEGVGEEEDRNRDQFGGVHARPHRTGTPEIRAGSADAVAGRREMTILFAEVVCVSKRVWVSPAFHDIDRAAQESEATPRNRREMPGHAAPGSGCALPRYFYPVWTGWGDA